MHVARREPWTIDEANEFLEAVRADFGFDGMKPVLNHEFREGLLEISCMIEISIRHCRVNGGGK